MIGVYEGKGVGEKKEKVEGKRKKFVCTICFYYEIKFEVEEAG